MGTQITSRVFIDDLLLFDGPDRTVMIEGAEVFVAGKGFSLGSAQPVDQTIESMIQDGSLVRRTSHDNRTVTFVIGFLADDGRSLARAVDRVWAACAKPGAELVYVPPAEDAAACCFPIQVGEPTPVDPPNGLDADLEEVMRGARWYQVTLTCSPWALARETTTVTAGGTGDGDAEVTVVISDGTSTAGWSSAGYDNTITSDGGNLTTDTVMAAAPYNSTSREFAFAHTLDGHDLEASPFLVFDLAGTARVATVPPGVPSTFGPWVDWTLAPDVWIGSASSPAVKASSYSLGGGLTRYTYDLTGFTGGQLVIHIKTGVTSGSSYSVALEVKALLDNVKLTNHVPTPQGGEQVLALTIDGAVRTPGELLLQHPTQGLGKVVLYSAPSLLDGYTPGLLQHVDPESLGAAVTVPDVGTFTGGTTWYPWAGTRFEVPISALPAGPYLLKGHLRNPGAARSAVLTWSAHTEIGGNTVGPIDTDGSPLTDFPATSQDIYELGGMVLDPLGAGSATGAVVVIELDETTGILFDELLLCHVPDDAFGPILVDCGEGDPALGAVHNVLKIKTASAASPTPQILVGISGVDEQMISAASWAGHWEQPTLTPGPLDVLVAATGTQKPTLQASYRRAYPHYVE